MEVVNSDVGYAGLVLRFLWQHWVCWAFLTQSLYKIMNLVLQV